MGTAFRPSWLSESAGFTGAVGEAELSLCEFADPAYIVFAESRAAVTEVRRLVGLGGSIRRFTGLFVVAWAELLAEGRRGDGRAADFTSSEQLSSPRTETTFFTSDHRDFPSSPMTRMRMPDLLRMTPWTVPPGTLMATRSLTWN